MIHQHGIISIETVLDIDCLVATKIHCEFFISKPYIIKLSCTLLSEVNIFKEIHSTLIHSPIKIKLHTDTQPIYYMCGVVENISIDNESHSCFIILRPALYNFGTIKRFHVFSNTSYIEIIQFMIRNIIGVNNPNLKIHFDAIKNGFIRNSTITQYYETDFEFLHRILFEANIHYYYRFHKNFYILHFYDNQHLQPKYPESLEVSPSHDRHNGILSHYYDIFPGLQCNAKPPLNKHSYFITQSIIRVLASNPPNEAFIQNELSFVPTTYLFKPIPQTKKPIVHSLQKAHVISDGKTPFDVHRFGTIKIQFQTDETSSSASYPSNHQAYARVTESEEDRWGILWIPRLNQEVFISFNHGNIDDPIIVGTVESYTSQLNKASQFAKPSLESS